MSHRLSIRKRTMPLLCALTVAAAQCPLAFADPVNGTFDGRDVAGGTYLNTAGGKTTFTNSAGTGLHVSAGSTVVGREVDGAGNMTGNGGHLHFNAPGQVVRIDGNIDVSAVMKNGAFVGNGGRVTVDSAFLYQNGQIFANGLNGGNVNFNVASLTMSPTASIQAQGTVGAGGRVDVNATGVVNIAKGAIVDTTGQVIGNYDTNVIAIKGGLVNLDGILLANGGVPGAKGGLVEVNATGNATALNTQAIAKSNLFSAAEQSDLASRDSALIASANGNVVTGVDARISANGANGAAEGGHGGDGGQIKFVAAKDIVNNGTLEVNGGAGGESALVAMGDIFIKEENGYSYTQQESKGVNGGNGGNAGEMFFVYGSTMTNNGKIVADGGYGGKGGNSSANSPDAQGHYAVGGDGGNGGNGGYIRTYGADKMTDNGNISLAGGSGGNAGVGKVDCGCEVPGNPGNPGNPGEIVHTEPCDTPPPPPPDCEQPPPPPPCEETPPPETPPTPDRPTGEVVIPRNGILQADRQAPVGQVLTYNRSIFLARPAVPAVARPPAPAVRFAQVVPKPDAPPMPAPPEKKKVVRGFW